MFSYRARSCDTYLSTGISDAIICCKLGLLYDQGGFPNHLAQHYNSFTHTNLKVVQAILILAMQALSFFFFFFSY